MANIKNPALETVNPDRARVDPPSRNTGAPSIDQITGGLRDLYSGIQKNKQDAQDQATLAGISGEFSDIVSNAGQARAFEESIYAGLSGTQDEQQLRNLENTLTQFRAGQLQGHLTPAAAMMRINNLSKQYQMALPGLADKVRALSQSYYTNLSEFSSLEKEDPNLTEWRDVQKTALQKGWSFRTELQYRRDLAETARLKAASEAAAAAGDLAEPRAAQEFLNTTTLFSKKTGQVVISDLIAEAKQDFANGTFSKEQWAAKLGIAKAQLEAGFDAWIADMQTNPKDKDGNPRKDFFGAPMSAATLNANLNFLFKNKKAILDEALAPLNTLITMAQNADSYEQQKRIHELQHTLLDEKGADFLTQLLGPELAALARTPEAAAQLLTEMGKVSDQFQHGQLATIRAQAKYNPIVALMLRQVEKGGFYDILNGHAARALDGDTTAGEGLPESIQRVSDQVAARVIKGMQQSGAFIDKGRVNTFSKAVTSDRPIEWLYRNRKSFSPLWNSDDGTAVRYMEERMGKELSAIIAKADPSVLQGLSFTPDNGWTFTPRGVRPHSKAVPPGRHLGAQSDMSGDRYGTHNQFYSLAALANRGHGLVRSLNDGEAVAEYLNMMYEVSKTYKDPSEAASTTRQMFEERVLARANGDMDNYKDTVRNATFDMKPDGTVTMNGNPVDNLTTQQVEEARRQLTGKYPENAELINAMFGTAGGTETAASLNNPMDRHAGTADNLPHPSSSVQADYDYEGARKAGLAPKGRNGHWPDEYKLPNHITFSTDSKYSGPGHEGGAWSQVDGVWHYKPSPFVLAQHSPEELKKYFAEHEKDAVLDLP